MKEKICSICGLNFISKREKKFCSKDCAKENNRQINGFYNRLNVSCCVCEQNIIRTQGQLKGKKYTVCSPECLGILNSRNLKGRPKSEQTIQRQNASKTKDKIIKTGSYTCGKCLKCFENNLALRAHSSWCAKIQQVTVCTKCEKEFGNSTSYKIHQQLWCDPEGKAKISKKISASVYTSTKRRKTHYKSKPEIAFIQAIKALGFNVVDNFIITGINHVYDLFLIDYNTLIEFDGDYWHENPEIYPAPTPLQREKQRKDLYANKKAIEYGYNIHRVWQSQSFAYIDHLTKEKENGSEAVKNFIDQENRKLQTSL